MPYKYKRTTRRKPAATTTKRRTYRKRSYKGRKSSTRVHRPLSYQGGFPKTLTTNLVYADEYDFSSNGSTISVQQINLASIYDPDVSLGGHQPYYRDQLASLYTSYKVISCKVEFVASQYVPGFAAGTAGTPSSFAAQLLVRATNYSGLPGNFNLELERDGCMIFDVVAGAKPFRFKRTFSVPYVLGVKKMTYMTDDDYWTNMGNNPTFPVPSGGYNTPYLNIAVLNPSTAGTVYVNLRMKLTYYVQFCGRILQSQS